MLESSFFFVYLISSEKSCEYLTDTLPIHRINAAYPATTLPKVGEIVSDFTYMPVISRNTLHIPGSFAEKNIKVLGERKQKHHGLHLSRHPSKISLSLSMIIFLSLGKILDSYPSSYCETLVKHLKSAKI